MEYTIDGVFWGNSITASIVEEMIKDNKYRRIKMTDRTLVVYSSLTGNTKAVGEKIFEIIEGEKNIVSIDDIKNVNIDNFQKIIIGFWVDKGSADKKTRDFIKSFSNKKVGYFGTLGADPESKHGNDVRERVSKLCSEKNTLIGGFLCRGKIDPKLVEKMGKFPLN